MLLFVHRWDIYIHGQIAMELRLGFSTVAVSQKKNQCIIMHYNYISVLIVVFCH